MNHTSIFVRAKQCLHADDIAQKIALTRQTAEDWRQGLVSHQDNGHCPITSFQPGRPQKPELVPPNALPQRGMGSTEGRAAMIHAIVHIEFNAINLACDALYRFRDMPRQYYEDWLFIAEEEAYHFELLRKRLNDIGYDYGDFDAHNGLWDVAQRSGNDILHRMVAIPRVMEARGLDVTPSIMKKLTSVGDQATVDILKIILHDEIGHVAAGTRWFRYVCKSRNLDPDQTFQEVMQCYFPGAMRGPMNIEARQEADFSDQELRFLQSLS